MVSEKLASYLADAFEDNAYLRGDDLRSTRKYLEGWVGSLFRRGVGRLMNDAERACMEDAIDQFVKEG